MSSPPEPMDVYANMGSPKGIPAYSGLPPGAVIAFAGYVGPLTESSPPGFSANTPPQGFGMQNPEAFGWMVCDGRKLYCNRYPNLFMMLGFLYNVPGDEYAPGYTGYLENDAMFRIPDYRGYFLRMANGEGQSNGNALPYGVQGGNIGSIRQEALVAHPHASQSADHLATGRDAAVALQPGQTANAINSVPTGKTNGAPGGMAATAQTQPQNKAVYYLIKFA